MEFFNALLGSHRALRSSYVFLFLIPMAVKLFQLLPADVDIPAWSAEAHWFTKSLSIPIRFPISWGLLFAIALFATVANAIYDVRCPQIVKSFRDFPSYHDSGRTMMQLADTAFDLQSKRPRPSSTLERDDIVKALNGICARLNYSSNQNGQYADVAMMHKEAYAGLFFLVRDAARKSDPISRLFASVFYLLSFACIGYLTLQNAWFVATLVSR